MCSKTYKLLQSVSSEPQARVVKLTGGASGLKLLKARSLELNSRTPLLCKSERDDTNLTKDE